MFICHGGSNKQDYGHCSNLCKVAGRHPVYVGACAQVCMYVLNVVFFDRQMESCSSVVKVYDWLD